MSHAIVIEKTPFTADQLKVLLKSQYDLQMLINPEWFRQGYKWYRYAMIEGAEASEHLGCKHWGPSADRDQANMEIIDAGAFTLCQLLEDEILEGENENLFFEIDKIIDTIVGDMMRIGGKYEFIVAKDEPIELSAVDFYIHQLVKSEYAGWNEFLRLFGGSGSMNRDDYFYKHLGKNALFAFRQEHGYSRDEYIKVWDGKEDNTYLTKFISEGRMGQVPVGQFNGYIKNRLLSRYSTVVGINTLTLLEPKEDPDFQG